VTDDARAAMLREAAWRLEEVIARARKNERALACPVARETAKSVRRWAASQLARVDRLAAEAGKNSGVDR